MQRTLWEFYANKPTVVICSVNIYRYLFDASEWTHLAISDAVSALRKHVFELGRQAAKPMVIGHVYHRGLSSVLWEPTGIIPHLEEQQGR